MLSVCFWWLCVCPVCLLSMANCFIGISINIEQQSHSVPNSYFFNYLTTFLTLDSMPLTIFDAHWLTHKEILFHLNFNFDTNGSDWNWITRFARTAHTTPQNLWHCYNIITLQNIHCYVTLSMHEFLRNRCTEHALSMLSLNEARVSTRILIAYIVPSSSCFNAWQYVCVGGKWNSFRLVICQIYISKRTTIFVDL